MADALLCFSLSLFVMLLYGAIVIYAERKVAAFIQARLGPYEVGPHGLLQSVADVLKLMQKEEIIPARARPLPMRMAPAVAFVPTFSSLALLPLFPSLQREHTEVGALLLLGLLSLHVIAIFMAGWSTGSKFSLYGAFRSVSQLLSYEVPLGLCVVCVVLITGTLNLHTMATQQSPGFYEDAPLLGLFSSVNTSAWGGFFAWNIARVPLLVPVFMLFFVSALAQANRTPFDLPEAESELVGGYHTEYTGFAWLLLTLTEYGVMLVLSLLAIFFFFGGGYSPLPNVGALRLADWTNHSTGWHFFLATIQG